MASPYRRQVLEALALGTSSLVAGCPSLSGRTDTDHPASSPSQGDASTQAETPFPTPVENPRASPAPTCRDGYHSLDPWYVVTGAGPLGGFRLSLGSTENTRGDTLTATVRNVTDSEQDTGNKKKYDIQYRSESGWHTILGTENEIASFTDEAVGHQPQEGFSWELPLTQDGLSNAVDHLPTFYVCHPLDPGDYRFVYWGLSSELEANTDYETDYALGVRFTLSDD